MCQFKSALIFKNRVVLSPKEDESHSHLLNSLGIKDNYFNSSNMFVRAELIPPNGNKSEDIKNWKYVVDQDIVPDWYKTDPVRYENALRDKVAEYMKTNYVSMVGRLWTAIKTDEKGTYYLLDGDIGASVFGENKNYAESKARELVVTSELAKDLIKEFGDRLVPITTNLLSFDGLKDYGVVEGDIIALPTLDLYRECREEISGIGKWWWLVTPDSTPSGAGASCVQYICSSGYSSGRVGYSCNWCGRALRPFFILKNLES